jgi:hypothetical protein
MVVLSHRGRPLDKSRNKRLIPVIAFQTRVLHYPPPPPPASGSNGGKQARSPPYERFTQYDAELSSPQYEAAIVVVETLEDDDSTATLLVLRSAEMR